VKFIMIFILSISTMLFSKEISIKSKDGYTLKGWINLPSKQKTKYPLAVIAHQFGSDHNKWISFAKELRKMGFATLNIDLRGHGKSILKNNKEVKIVKFHNLSDLKSSFKKSAKKVGFNNLVDDISRWIEYISDNYKVIDSEDISFFGASLSGATLIGTMFDYEPKLAVLFSPGSVSEVGGDGEISEISSPIMFVSSVKDFAFSRTIKYTKEANLPTTLILPGSGHGEALLKNSEKYVKDFIKRYR